MYVELGKIVGVWGYLQEPRKKTDPVAIEVINCREQAQGIVAQLDGVVDRDQAMSMNGQTIFIKKQEQEGQADVLIPYTDQAVVEIDVEKGTMIVDWDPSYLLD